MPNLQIPSVHKNLESNPDPDFFLYEEDEIHDNLNHIPGCLLGKIITDKPIHKGLMQVALSNICCNPKNLLVKEVESAIFQIRMDSVEDHRRILKGNIWLFRNSWFILREWDGKSYINNLDFEKAHVWMQLWGLSVNAKTTQMGIKLGGKFGEVLDAGIYDIPDKVKIVKVKINLSIRNPISPGMYIGSKQNRITWVDFRYERLPFFCF